MALQLIKGGLYPGSYGRYKFIEGKATDTRLMGVVGVHLVWEDSASADQGPLHQFYYFDYEELGLDYLRIYVGSDEREIADILKENFGGLGASYVSLTERESRYIVKFFAEDTKAKGEQLPEDIDTVAFILDDGQEELSSEEKRELDLKMSAPIRSDYGVINYYLMRCFGKDPSGSELLLSPAAKKEDIQDVTPPYHATFLRNKIETLPDSAGMHKSYRCESLIETDRGHMLVVSTVGVFRRAVTDVELVSSFAVSVYEASMMLSKHEFITVYDVTAMPDDFLDMLDEFLLGCTRTGHANGEMFMEFMPHNDHVEKKLFFLSDDIKSLYFASDGGQLIIAAYNIENILAAESRLITSPFSNMLTPTNRYQFQSSLLYDFADSDFDDFNDFLDSLT